MRKVLVGGVFNIIHPGHLYFFEEARKFGDYLVVVIARDNTAMKRKGVLPIPQEERKHLVESLKVVDRAVIGKEIRTENDFIEIVKQEMPDVIVLGHDQKIDEKRLKKNIQSSGLKCDVIRAGKRLKNYSTSKIIGSIKTKSGNKWSLAP